MEGRSGKRKRAPVASKLKRRSETMNDGAENVGDYLDFLSNIGKDGGIRKPGEEEHSYLHDESLLLSPLLTDYVNRSNASSSTDGYGSIATNSMIIPSLRMMSHLEEEDRTGQEVVDERRLRDGNQNASSPERQENVHSVWQLDSSNCASLGLGSTTSADSSCISDIAHHSTQDSTKLVANQYEDNKMSDDCGYKSPIYVSRGNERRSLERMNDGNKNGNDQLVSGSQNCATDSRKEIVTLDMKESQVGLSCHDTNDDSIRNHEERYPDIAMNQVAFDNSDLQKTGDDGNLLDISSNRSGSNSSVEAPKAWFSRLSNVVPYARQERKEEYNLSYRDREEKQASGHATEDNVFQTKPQHNTGNEEADKATQQEDADHEDVGGINSWSSPTPDNRDTNLQYSEQKEYALPYPKTPQSLQHEKENTEIKIKSGDYDKDIIGMASSANPTVGSPSSKISLTKSTDNVRTNYDDPHSAKKISISETWQKFVEQLTPSKDRKSLLSPVLKKSVSKLLDKGTISEKTHDNLICDENMRSPLQHDSTQAGLQLLDNGKTNIPFSTISNIELSLTPALRKLRSRMMGETCENEIDVTANIGSLIEKHIKFDNEEDDCVRTPTNARAENSFDGVHTPSTLEKSPGSNLTPALQALKSRIDLYSSDEDYATPQSLTRSFQKGNNISNRKSPITPLDEDDSYLEQPKDLSSAKKKLTAQSSALVERLRGAAQRRKMQLSRSRNSIIAREQKYLMTLETNDDLVYSPDIDSEEIDEENETESPVCKTPYRPFKARPLPATTLGRSGGHSGVPKVRKRPTTTPKSPMLGSRRTNTTKSESKHSCSSHKNKSLHPKNRKQVVDKSPASTPASTCVAESCGPKRVSKMKKRIVSLPKTSCDGINSKEIKSTKSILHSAVSKVNMRPNGNHERRNVREKASIGLDTKSCPREKPPLVLHQCRQTKRIEDQENIQTIRLHSTIRAGERAQFDAHRILSEKKRQDQLNIERDAAIKEKHIELNRLKNSLR